ncbi:MAG: hypothetical protein ACFBZ9_17530 [Sphingomonadales bacterium]
MTHKEALAAAAANDPHWLLNARIVDVFNLFFACPRTRLMFAQLRALRAFESISK